jgi:two-component system, OmpR family, sensor histidine kinase ChvG
MSLRRQLLLVSLLLLCLPWAGCQYIREMEGALRQGQADALQATANSVAAVLASTPALLYPDADRTYSAESERGSIYVLAAQAPIIVDGYGDGWEDIAARRFEGDSVNNPLSLEVKAQTRENHLYLLFHIADPKVIYHNPGISREPNGDRLILRLWPNGKRQEYVIATAAPGTVRARIVGKRQRGIDPGRIQGQWQDAKDGYTLELEIPLEYTGHRLGFYLIDENAREGRAKRYLGTVKPLDTAAPPWLIYPPQNLEQTLSAFTGAGREIIVADNRQWRLARSFSNGRDERDEGSAHEAAEADETFWLLRLIYRSILSSDDLTPAPEHQKSGKIAGAEVESALMGDRAMQRYRDAEYSSRTLLSISSPIGDTRRPLGAVIVRQSGETYLSLTDQAFSRLLGISLLAICVAALGLLGYASILSWRIRTLSQATNRALSDNGRVISSFTPSRAQDEIGELSRHYADLLSRLKEYNDYLQTLSRKLSHELRTPIAVIKSSLENLEHSSKGENASESKDASYLQRAREGLERLQHILTAMSESSRLEESIHNQTPAIFDLVPLMKQVTESYRSVHSYHTVTLKLNADVALLEGVPELIVQALDKFVENAASFAPEGSNIHLQLNDAGQDWEIEVSNSGSALPRELGKQVFEPMVSLRQEGGKEVHLGLGLHIVRLIADFHRGKVNARNLPGDEGVAFSIALPKFAEPDDETDNPPTAQ